MIRYFCSFNIVNSYGQKLGHCACTILIKEEKVQTYLDDFSLLKAKIKSQTNEVSPGRDIEIISFNQL